jgi:CRISPR-associated protein Csb2
MLYITVTSLTGEYGGKEFPPAPSRLLQAAIAGVQGDSRIFPAIQVLEHLQPPEIFSRAEIGRYEYSSFVPNNDDSMAHEKTRKQNRRRILETFGPHVIYVWGDFPSEMLEGIKYGISNVYALGLQGDLVRASASDNRPEVPTCFDRWVPDDGQMTGATEELYTPVAGFLDSVLEKYQGRRNDIRVRRTIYRRNPKQQAAMAVFDLRDVLTGERFSVPIWKAAVVAEWVRHAAAKAMPEFAEGISGHTNDGRRLSILPLPSIGHEHADMRVRRVMVVEADGDGQIIASARVSLNGQKLIDEDGNVICYLSFSQDRDFVSSAYVGSSAEWESITPCILPGFDSFKPHKYANLARRMFAHGGYPKPKHIEIMPWGLGGLKAREFFVPRKHDHHRNPRLFCRVEFSLPVDGPLFVGRGRHYGMGIFAKKQSRAAG